MFIFCLLCHIISFMGNWKKTVLILIFSVFSLCVFAAPSGGAGGGHGSPSGGRRPSPEPKRNPPAKKAPSNSTLKKGRGTSVSGRSLSENKNSESKNIEEIDNEKPSEPEIIYYRGNRMLSENGDFLLENIKTERISDSQVIVEIAFNQSVNPLSFSASSFLLDGSPISESVKLSFNKKGDTIRLTLPVKEKFFSLTIQNVEAFDGTKLETVEVKNLFHNSGGK